MALTSKPYFSTFWLLSKKRIVLFLKLYIFYKILYLTNFLWMTVLHTLKWPNKMMTKISLGRTGTRTNIEKETQCCLLKSFLTNFTAICKINLFDTFIDYMGCIRAALEHFLISKLRYSCCMEPDFRSSYKTSRVGSDHPSSQAIW